MVVSSSEWIRQLSETLGRVQCKVGALRGSLENAESAVHGLFSDLREREGSVWWVGNGGSSAICSHLSQDVLNKLKIRSFVLSDASLLTCVANDFGYEKVYSYPLERMVRSDDLMIAVSSSGNSKNILECADLCKKKSLRLITCSAFEETNALWKSPADVSFYIPAKLYGIAEVGHEALLHSMIETMWLKEQEGKSQ